MSNEIRSDWHTGGKTGRLLFEGDKQRAIFEDSQEAQRVAGLLQQRDMLEAEYHLIRAALREGLSDDENVANPTTEGKAHFLKRERDALLQQVAALTVALQKIGEWPANYPANANIERMRQFARLAALAEPAPQDPQVKEG